MLELKVDQFLQAPGIVLDVRSPGEFIQGRIPGAFSFPLFNNDERAQVGTTYKQNGREQAVELGLKLVGPKLADFVTQAKNLAQENEASQVKVHCWRGGMRSSSMAWLLETAGLKTATLKGGYKAFRRHCLETFANVSEIPSLNVLGGLTGCGKTNILHALKRLGEQVIDLEQIANHKGSSYGMIGMTKQPSIEQFENELAMQIRSLDLSRRVWIEDESHMIGVCKIPDSFFKKIRQSKLYVIERPMEERIEQLLHEYGSVNSDSLIEATQRISRRIGGAMTKEIIAHIQQGQLSSAIELVLKYYDSTYLYGLSQRNDIHLFSAEGLDHNTVAKQLTM